MNIAKGTHPQDAGVLGIGVPSLFSCPECHGVLLRTVEASPERFRCHTGHAYSARSLMASIVATSEDVMGQAVRALEEGALMLHHLQQHDGPDGEKPASLAAAAERMHRQADALRQALVAEQPMAVSARATDD